MPQGATPHRTWSPAEMRAGMYAAGVAIWAWDIGRDEFEMDAQGLALWDTPPGEKLTFEVLSRRIHPADVSRVRVAFTATRAITGSYEIDFRILTGDDIRWVCARGMGNDEDIAKGVMYGVFLDVTQRKHAEESQELLAGEMSHRVKNVLAIASALASITARSATSTAEMARDLSQRLAALGRAHDLVRPRGPTKRATLLGDLLSVLLAPYHEGLTQGRIRVAVPKLAVGEGAATTLALVMHELATNAMKYGSLSVPTGVLDVSGTITEDAAEITWTERGGPPVVAPGEHEGYGSRLINRTIAQQLGGSIVFDWSTGGAIITLRLSRDRLTG